MRQGGPAARSGNCFAWQGEIFGLRNFEEDGKKFCSGTEKFFNFRFCAARLQIVAFESNRSNVDLEKTLQDVSSRV
tara:strand:- start:215 stop:442 length:228 start_codon:yes stop_codon:yes gene_type:complete